MKIEINLNDYISEEEKKEIVVEAFRKEVYDRFTTEKEMTRILSNAGYQAVFKAIDEVSEKNSEMIIKQTMSLINNLEAQDVFKHCVYTGESQSFAARLVDKILLENKDSIKEKILQTFINKDLDEKIWQHFEKLAENFGELIYKISEIGKNNAKK